MRLNQRKRKYNQNKGTQRDKLILEKVKTIQLLGKLNILICTVWGEFTDVFFKEKNAAITNTV